MPAAGPNLQKIVARLAKHYGQPKPPISTDPLELILLENVAYLVSDERREEAFKTLRKHAGTKPHEILAASHEDILRATKLGGMRPEQRVGRLREIALIAMNEFGGDEKKSYTATYRSVQEKIKNQIKEDFDWLINAHLLLRQHGKVLCKTSQPLCKKCPVRKSCLYFQMNHT